VSALTESRKAETAISPGALNHWFARVIEGLQRAAVRRQTLHQLARLDDRMLKDIGLFRGDIDAAEALPRGRDPVALLASRRTARNNARFADRYY